MTFDGMAKVCAAAAGVADPQIVHYDPKSIEAPEHHDVFFSWEESGDLVFFGRDV